MHYSENTQKKIVNDPVYGFIKIPEGIIYELIEHPNFQRLRRIRQLGLTHLVYPGANHSRLQHAIGAMHLTNQAIETIRSKGHEILPDEAEAVQIAILLHDIGHGPFSHALERQIVPGVGHEDISLYMLSQLNIEFNGRLGNAISIFSNTYPKMFLHQLISGQLDMDRLDYLKRDSFFTGVSEGVISSDRIIKMLNVVKDELVVDEKGIYSIEKFLVARRLMYWQVYWHKTVLVAQQMLLSVYNRAKKAIANKTELFSTPSLNYFLKLNYSDYQNLNNNIPDWLHHFCNLDDDDLMIAIKMWAQSDDKVLAYLCKSLINRKLFRIKIQKEPFHSSEINRHIENVAGVFGLSSDDASDLVITGEISNNAYSITDDRIRILMKNNELKDISEASDMLNLEVLSKEVKKYFICFPRL